MPNIIFRTVVLASCIILLGAAQPTLDATSAPNRNGNTSKAKQPNDWALSIREFPDDQPAPPAALAKRSRSAATNVSVGPFVSVQVNIDSGGANIVGDAANEPSITVDPSDPTKMAIGWRQFDTIVSNFRQAGISYTQDGGITWTFPGVLDPGQFRSDPVLASDRNGVFFYSSLSSGTSAEVFTSLNGGVTWGAPVTSFGGDKQWIAVDRTTGIGDGNVYQIWNVQFSCCGSNDFTRSTNSGASFTGPYAVTTPSMKWGTMDVGPDGTLYLAGATLSGTGHLFTKSTDAQNPAVSPTFDTPISISMGGTVSSGGPNPGGLLGQVWVATDHSAGPTAGNIYVLNSVDPPGADPLDVHFIRSEDGGATWSSPVRVNDDPVGTNAYQWFGTMSVAPNGRIDVVFNDTRNSGVDNLSELFYTYSFDGGVTWAPNIVVSPQFDSHIGWPNQNKIGDYYDMISDDTGANLAYSATFNGEQDVYYLRLVLDCNSNGVDDATDIAMGTSQDCNSNSVPDECEPDEDCNGNTIQDICDIAGGTSEDCNDNSVPDECESSADCNNNSIPDICDIGSGTSQDCNANDVPDECDIALGSSSDANSDGIPDECQGACCTCGTCTLVSPSECTSSGGDFAGAGVFCTEVTCPVLGNDQCAVAQTLPALADQTIPFDNTCADTDGPASVSCDNGTQPFGADIWYQYTPGCDGSLTASLCDVTNYDAIMAIYDGGLSCQCPSEGATQVACSDDSCGVGGGPPTITIPVSAGDCYVVRVAGWTGATGMGELDLSFTPSVGGVDCQPNGLPDVCDLGSGVSLDCNSNSIPDECDFASGASTDCNNNGIPDECDIASGTSLDNDMNGIPDECVCMVATTPLPELIPDDTFALVPVRRPRYLTFVAGDAGRPEAIRVTYDDLPPPYDVLNGTQLWVGPPSAVCELPGVGAECTPGPNQAGFQFALLQCDPYYFDWTQLNGFCVDGLCRGSLNTGASCTSNADCPDAILHVTHASLVPSKLVNPAGPLEFAAKYHIDVIDQLCDPGVPADFSASLALETSGWGDPTNLASGIYVAPDDVVSTFDILGEVSAFTGLPNVKSKTRFDLVGAQTGPEPQVDLKITTYELIYVLDAFSGASYPFPPEPTPICP